GHRGHGAVLAQGNGAGRHDLGRRHGRTGRHCGRAALVLSLWRCLYSAHFHASKCTVPLQCTRAHFSSSSSLMASLPSLASLSSYASTSSSPSSSSARSRTITTSVPPAPTGQLTAAV